MKPKTCPICKQKVDFRTAWVTDKTASPSQIHCPKCDMVMYGKHFIPSHKGLLSFKQQTKAEIASNTELISRWNTRPSRLRVWWNDFKKWFGEQVENPPFAVERPGHWRNLTKTDFTCSCGGAVEVRLERKQERTVACCVCIKCGCYSQNTVPHFKFKNAITEAKEKWKHQSKSK